MKKSIKAMSVFMSAMLTLGSLGAVSLTAGAQESHWHCHKNNKR